MWEANTEKTQINIPLKSCEFLRMVTHPHPKFLDNNVLIPRRIQRLKSVFMKIFLWHEKCLSYKYSGKYTVNMHVKYAFNYVNQQAQQEDETLKIFNCVLGRWRYGWSSHSHLCVNSQGFPTWGPGPEESCSPTQPPHLSPTTTRGQVPELAPEMG